MQIKVDSNNLKEAIKKVQKLKTKGNNVLINTYGWNTTEVIKATNNTTIKVKFYAEKITENGNINLPETTSKLIQKINEELEINNNSIFTEKRQLKINRMNDKIDINYIDSTLEVKEECFKVSQKELKRMLEVKYCASNEEYRQSLKGVFFNNNETCACDGYRLSVRKSMEYTNNNNFIVNIETVELLNKLLNEKSKEMVNIYINKDKKDYVIFQFEDIEIIGQTIQEEYIKYNSLIPQEFDYKIEVKTKDIKEELNFTKDIKSNMIKFDITKENIKLIISECEERYSYEVSREKQIERQKELDKKHDEQMRKWEKIIKKENLQNLKKQSL